MWLDIETEMTNYFKRIRAITLLIAAANIMMAQSGAFKSLSTELKTLQKQLVPDKRVAILEVEIIDTLQTPITIKGETNLADAKAQILKLLADKKISFVDSIRLLPDAALDDKTWALATLSVSSIHLKPDHCSEMVSQVMMGTPMRVLEMTEKWYRIQTPENYIGWMDAGGLQRVSYNDLEHWKSSNRFLFNHLNGKIINTPTKKGEIVSDLVLGDLFEVESTVQNYLKIKTPDGRSGYVLKEDCISYDDWSQIKPNTEDIINVAKEMMGSPYLWGGVSSKAVDCSGFVKLAHYSQGIILARDASQQAKYGVSIDISNLKNLQAGDLLFFGSSAQHITHVGLYLSNGDFIHSSGRVHISSLIPSDPKYVATRHRVAACRVINSIDTEGIISVKKHPWYSIQP